MICRQLHAYWRTAQTVPLPSTLGGGPSLLHLPEEEDPSYKGQLCAGSAHTSACWGYCLPALAFSTSGCSNDSPVLCPMSRFLTCTVLKWGRHLQLPGRLSMAFSSAGPQCHGNLMCDRTPQTSRDIVPNRHTASYPEMSLQSPSHTTGMQLLSSLAQSYRAQILALGKSEWPW